MAKTNKNHYIHGGCGTRLYNIWKTMRQRCTYKNHSRYHIYGGKGIRVCEEWEDFQAFREWAFSNGYTDKLTIDRINVNGNYEPSNCRWVTYKMQANNKTSNHFVEFNGCNHTLAEWSEITGIKISTIWARLKTGWSVEDALTIQPRKGSNKH